MKLTILGTGNATVTECYNTCFALSDGNRHFLVDTGGGNRILKVLKDTGIQLEDIHDIFITHEHIDHLLGVIWLIRMIGQKKIGQGKYEGNLRIYCHEELARSIRMIAELTIQKKVTKYFDDFCALDEFSLKVESGSAYGLLGSNGAGKSTLLRILAGIYRQDSGDVTVDGEKIYDNVSVKQRVFYVSDDVEQYANMTPEDMRKMYEIFYPTFSNEKFARLMKAIDLPQNKRMSTFSKGMKRQAAVVCGLAASTDILLLDEAFDGLDPTMRISVRKMLFEAMAENNSTVIISSHNLTEIEELCDSVGLVHKGKVIFDRELDSIKGSIHKIQVAFDGARTAADFPELEILSENTIGSVQSFIVNGDSDEICRVMREKGAKFCDVIPLTLNEIFIYEMEGQGYDSSKLDK